MPIIKKGSVAIVTGGGSGIGFEFVKLLVAGGTTVLIADIALTSNCETFLNSHKDEAHYFKTDVTSWTDLSNLFTHAHKVLGGIDLVCPNAGIFEMPSSNFWYPPGSKEAKDTLEESRYKVLDVNITHPIRLTQMAIEYFMREGKEGHVLLVSSIAAQQPTFVKPMYSASKAAISSFTHSMAGLATPPHGIPKIMVNAVAPGMVRTPLWSGQEDMKGFLDSPFDWLEPEEIARGMMKIVTTDEYKGGEVVEVTLNNLRLQEVLNDPGPPALKAMENLTDEQRMEAMGPMIAPVHTALRRMMGGRGTGNAEAAKGQ